MLTDDVIEFGEVRYSCWRMASLYLMTSILQLWLLQCQWHWGTIATWLTLLYYYANHQLNICSYVNAPNSITAMDALELILLYGCSSVTDTEPSISAGLMPTSQLCWFRMKILQIFILIPLIQPPNRRGNIIKCVNCTRRFLEYVIKFSE